MPVLAAGMSVRQCWPRRDGAVATAAWLLLAAAVQPLAAQTTDTTAIMAGKPLHAGISAVVEELTIGVLDGPQEYAFASISDIAVGKDGAMLVLEASFRVAPLLRLYDSSGVFLRQVGRRGQGSGEFVHPSAVASTPDGDFLLLDRLNRRITVYSRTGDYRDSWPIPSFNTPRGVPGRMRVDPAGVIAIRFIMSFADLRAQADLKEAVVRLRTGGVVIDTLPEPRLPTVQETITITSQRNGTTVGARLAAPYSANALWQWSPLGYFVTGVSGRYAFDLRLPGLSGNPSVWVPGDGVRSIRVNALPVEIPPAERSDQRDEFARQLRMMRGGRAGRVPDVPRVKPFFQWFFVGEDGRIWAHIHTESERHDSAHRRRPLGWREANLFDVFEPSGIYLGRVRVPDDLHFLRFHGDQIWAVAFGDDDVQYLKRYRARWN